MAAAASAYPPAVFLLRPAEHPTPEFDNNELNERGRTRADRLTDAMGSLAAALGVQIDAVYARRAKGQDGVQTDDVITVEPKVRHGSPLWLRWFVCGRISVCCLTPFCAPTEQASCADGDGFGRARRHQSAGVLARGAPRTGAGGAQRCANGRHLLG